MTLSFLVRLCENHSIMENRNNVCGCVNLQKCPELVVPQANSINETLFVVSRAKLVVRMELLISAFFVQHESDQ